MTKNKQWANDDLLGLGAWLGAIFPLVWSSSLMWVNWKVVLVSDFLKTTLWKGAVGRKDLKVHSAVRGQGDYCHFPSYLACSFFSWFSRARILDLHQDIPAPSENRTLPTSNDQPSLKDSRGSRESNPSAPEWRRMLYPLRHRRSQSQLWHFTTNLASASWQWTPLNLVAWW